MPGFKKILNVGIFFVILHLKWKAMHHWHSYAKAKTSR